jgi:hypothetical protein
MPAQYPTKRNPFADGGQLSDMWARPRMPDMRMSNPEPVEATQGVAPEPNYSGGLGSLMGGMSGSVQQQNPAMAQHMSNLERQRTAIDARLNQVLPSGLTVGQQNAGWKVRPDGTFAPPGI